MLRSDRPDFGHRTSAKIPSPPATVSAEQSLLVREFIARVGGVENARRALELLAMLRRAA